MRRIALCDDVELERHILKELLLVYLEETGEDVSVTEYETGEKLITDAEEGQLTADLLFLDIYMDGMNGMETARKLREMDWKGPIVFLTASPDFAIESYEVEASGYLLKPYDAEKIRELTARILKTDEKKRLVVKSRRQYRYPYTDGIRYIDSDRHTVTIHLDDDTEIVSQEKLGDIEERIGEDRFLRCHQSYLVNMDYIRDVQEDFILSDDTRIPIRVRGRKEILDQYYQYFVDQNGKQARIQ